MANLDTGFRDRVYAVVEQIPKGRLMSYGQIAAICGSPRSARIVGGITHFGPLELPWQRVVKRDGSLAEGYPGGIEGHRQALAAEGVTADANLKVDLEKLRWQP